MQLKQKILFAHAYTRGHIRRVTLSCFNKTEWGEYNIQKEGWEEY